MLTASLLFVFGSKTQSAQATATYIHYLLPEVVANHHLGMAPSAALCKTSGALGEQVADEGGRADQHPSRLAVSQLGRHKEAGQLPWCLNPT